jgi:cytochrome oxidase Cu insertion factor (SCO1/SenC/PrrC family)
MMGMKLASLAAIILGMAATAACSQGPSGAGDARAPVTLGTGGVAPEFSLVSADGGNLALTEFRGESPVLLYFSMGPG